MSRAGTYDTRGMHRATTAKDVETWLGNSLATILAGLGIASGVIGLFVAFDYISTSVNDPFQNGMVWMVGGLILAISGNVFRREHHIKTFDEDVERSRYDSERPTRYEPPMQSEPPPARSGYEQERGRR